MKELTKKSLKLFDKLHKETQSKFLLALEFSVQSQETTLKQIKSRNPDLKIDFEPLCADELKPAVNHG